MKENDEVKPTELIYKDGVYKIDPPKFKDIGDFLEDNNMSRVEFADKLLKAAKNDKEVT